jgi:hypothetical protein
MKQDLDLSRRHFISRAAKSFLGVSALYSLPDFGRAAGAGASTAKQVATAKRVIYLYMDGGMSHLDTFDPKTDGEVMGPTKRLDTKVDDLKLSDNLPLLGRHADKLAVVRSMTAKFSEHAQGNLFMHTGFPFLGFPSAGAWLSYALGSLNENLPTYIAIQDIRGEPPNGKANWGNGFLPAEHQGVTLAAQQSDSPSWCPRWSRTCRYIRTKSVCRC